MVVRTETSSDRGGITLGEFRSEICPIGVITDQSVHYLDLYQNCMTFHCLPRPGGVSEQDNKTLEAFSVIRGEYNRMDQEHMKERERKAQNVGK